MLYRVRTWAHKLGFELSQLGKYVTNVEKFHESYKQAVVKPRDGNALVHEIAKDINAMMESKISAIKVYYGKMSNWLADGYSTVRRRETAGPSTIEQ